MMTYELWDNDISSDASNIDSKDQQSKESAKTQRKSASRSCKDQPKRRHRTLYIHEVACSQMRTGLHEARNG